MTSGVKYVIMESGGKKMSDKKKKISITLPEILIDELAKLAKEKMYSKSFLMRLALEDLLKREKGEMSD